MQASKAMRPKQVAECWGCGMSTMWRWVKELPDAPQPMRMSARLTVFDEGEVIRFRDSRKGIAAQGPKRDGAKWQKLATALDAFSDADVQAYLAAKATGQLPDAKKGQP